MVRGVRVRPFGLEPTEGLRSVYECGVRIETALTHRHAYTRIMADYGGLWRIITRIMADY